uniref:Stealth_CR2 domain-containing protein n=1 Tax=Macrostomum lignano TaxID=282301 RepID=A0A1I8FGF9_9PLAT
IRKSRQNPPLCRAAISLVAFEVSGLVRNGRLRRLFWRCWARRRGLRREAGKCCFISRGADWLWRISTAEQDREEQMKTALELKYSLRSLTNSLPGYEIVYLVTNGQVPNWLNLTNPRLTLITHEPVHPHDFYCPRSGYRIYQSWEVRQLCGRLPARLGVAWLLRSACNNSHCDFDGGDCLNAQLPVGRWLMPNLANLAAAGQLRLAGAGSADLLSQPDGTSVRATWRSTSAACGRGSINQMSGSYEVASASAAASGFGNNSVGKFLLPLQLFIWLRLLAPALKWRGFSCGRPVVRPPPPPLQLSQSADASSGEINMFDKSLKFTNKVLSGAFGYSVREVPPHMPHFINMFRSKDEMQYSFAYYSFLLHQLKNRSLSYALRELDREWKREPLQWKSKPAQQALELSVLQQVAENATKKQHFQLSTGGRQLGLVSRCSQAASFESTNNHLQENFLCLNDDMN